MKIRHPKKMSGPEEGFRNNIGVLVAGGALCTMCVPAGPCTLSVQNSTGVWFHATKLASAVLAFGEFVGSRKV